jgi:hypothetical protein
MLGLVGRVADGWIPSLPYAPPDTIAERQQRIDEGAAEAGRDPAAIRRAYNIMGEIGAEPGGVLEGPVSLWIETLTSFAVELGFDTFVLWPGGEDPARQLGLFAEEVVPAVRAEVERARA